MLEKILKIRQLKREIDELKRKKQGSIIEGKFGKERYIVVGTPPYYDLIRAKKQEIKALAMELKEEQKLIEREVVKE